MDKSICFQDQIIRAAFHVHFLATAYTIVSLLFNFSKVIFGKISKSTRR